MERLLRGFLGDEGGATAIEYGLLAALIALVVLIGITFAGGSLQFLFNHTASKATSVWDNVNMG